MAAKKTQLQGDPTRHTGRWTEHGFVPTPIKVIKVVKKVKRKEDDPLERLA